MWKRIILRLHRWPENKIKTLLHSQIVHTYFPGTLNPVYHTHRTSDQFLIEFCPVAVATVKVIAVTGKFAKRAQHNTAQALYQCHRDTQESQWFFLFSSRSTWTHLPSWRVTRSIFARLLSSSSFFLSQLQTHSLLLSFGRLFFVSFFALFELASQLASWHTKEAMHVQWYDAHLLERGSWPLCYAEPLAHPPPLPPLLTTTPLGKLQWNATERACATVSKGSSNKKRLPVAVVIDWQRWPAMREKQSSSSCGGSVAIEEQLTVCSVDREFYSQKNAERSFVFQCSKWTNGSARGKTRTKAKRRRGRRCKILVN